MPEPKCQNTWKHEKIHYKFNQKNVMPFWPFTVRGQKFILTWQIIFFYLRSKSRSTCACLSVCLSVSLSQIFSSETKLYSSYLCLGISIVCICLSVRGSVENFYPFPRCIMMNMASKNKIIKFVMYFFMFSCILTFWFRRMYWPLLTLTFALSFSLSLCLLILTRKLKFCLHN